MDKNLSILFEKYAEMFDDGFPTIPLATGRTDAEVAEIIKECLSKNKDVYALGYCKDDAIY